MIPIRVGWLAAVGCLLLFSFACNDESAGTGGAGGVAGTGGAAGSGGTGDEPAQVPGLWEGQANGLNVCFYVSEDGLRLTQSAECNVTGPPNVGSNSYDIRVEAVGTDDNGERCSFDLGFSGDAVIDQKTNSFAVTGFQPDGSDAVLSFSGELTGRSASGVAQSEIDGSVCRVGWAAAPESPCDDPAIQTCLDLLDCCRAILVNPVFFETCNSVVLQCDQAQCQRVLDGYPQCEPEPEP